MDEDLIIGFLCWFHDKVGEAYWNILEAVGAAVRAACKYLAYFCLAVFVILSSPIWIIPLLHYVKTDESHDEPEENTHE